MGCAASTTASVPAQTSPPTGQQQQPAARPVNANQIRPQGAAGPPGGPGPPQQPRHNLTDAPIIRSLVDLKREDCTIENGQDGSYVRLRFSSLTAGEVSVYFNVREMSSDENSMAELEASQVSKQNFSPGSAQLARLFLCKDISAALEGWDDKAKDKHHMVIELRAESSDPRAITVQRSCLKLNGESTSAQVTLQKVQCGTAVRTLQALYGTMPNPKRPDAAAQSGDPESGECVICLSKPREVAILHCRHVCLCRSCATITSSTWSFQCPVCRGRVASMCGLVESGEGS